MKERYFNIIDTDTTICVEQATRKELLQLLENYIEDGCNEDEKFQILYKNGDYAYIGYEYDGHKIRKQNIVTIVYDNVNTIMVFGGFGIDFYGNVYPAVEESIVVENIVEVESWGYSNQEA